MVSDRYGRQGSCFANLPVSASIFGDGGGDKSCAIDSCGKLIHAGQARTAAIVASSFVSMDVSAHVGGGGCAAAGELAFVVDEAPGARPCPSYLPTTLEDLFRQPPRRVVDAVLERTG